MENVTYVYRIASEEEWKYARSSGVYTGGQIDDKFIHLSTASQVPGTLERFFPGRTDLLLLKVDCSRVAQVGQLKWEAADSEIFPHFYGATGDFAPLPLDTLVASAKVHVLDHKHVIPDAFIE